MLESTPMKISHLSLTNFRNFVRLEIDFPDGPSILVGQNAQGKTSLLEALYYLTSANSPHAASDRQLINFLALKETPPFSRLVAEISKAGRLHRIEIRIVLESTTPTRDQRLKKEILINGLKRRAKDLAGGFNTVLFLPQDMRVVEGPPGERRKYLNNALSQSDPTYAAALIEYSKVLSQRNALLKRLQDRGNGGSELQFWDEQIAEFGATLMRARMIALEELENNASEIHRKLTRDRESISLEYAPSYHPLDLPQDQLGLPLSSDINWSSISREEIRSGLLDSLSKSRREELARGMTILGPHRDDFRFIVDGLDLRMYGSRGQNRTAMLAMKLGEVDWLHQRTGEWPVLLLDEVLAELDPYRRDDLLQCVGNVNQAILTSADVSMFDRDFQDEANIWEIEAGTIKSFS
jgi:DNA replication and repair protein RecF